MVSRRLEDLHPITREKAQRLTEEAKKQGIDTLIYMTYRSPEEQDLLYFQGRLKQFGLTVEELNRRRQRIGLLPLTEKEANTVVTSVRGWQSFHQYGLAFDIAVVKQGKIDWNDTQSYQKLGQIGKSLGLVWGGDWKMKDLVHFQDEETYTRIKRG